jgi:hypothetical protein
VIAISTGKVLYMMVCVYDLIVLCVQQLFLNAVNHELYLIEVDIYPLSPKIGLLGWHCDCDLHWKGFIYDGVCI